MLRKNCKECGKFIWTYPSRIKDGKGKYCSKACADKNRSGLPKGDMIEKICIECGVKFEAYPYRKDRKFCSKSCHYKHKRDKRECLNCSDIFTIRSSRPDKYCSPECYHEHNSIVNRVNVICEECDTKFTVPKNNIARGRGRFCSEECRDEYYRNGDVFSCNRCGDKFYRSKSRIKRGQTKYCSETCAAEVNAPIRIIKKKTGLQRYEIPVNLINTSIEYYELKRQIKEVKQ